MSRYKDLNPEQQQTYREVVTFLKVAIGGDPNWTIPIWDAMALLGKEECLTRMKRLLKRIV